MKILVIFTGGTISCSVNEGYFSPDVNKKYFLIEKYNEIKTAEVDFDFSEPYMTLSENITGEEISMLGECVSKHINKGYDGIIITHGTDTLQYSSAALSYLFNDISIPVMLVSSNYILDNPLANGISNFYYSVDFILNRNGNGVFTAYRNSDGATYIHKGSRVLPHLPDDDNLYSIGNQYYGAYKGKQFTFNSGYTAKNSGAFHLGMPKTLESGVLRIYPYPGMTYPMLNEDINAILLETYHSGTICSVAHNFRDFTDRAAKLNIPIFIIGNGAAFSYESMKIFDECKIHVLPQASNISIYMKLWMAAALDNSELLKIMDTCICGEYI